MAATALQITANQANALHSTGPRSDEGKLHSSRNHQSHGLTTRHALLPGEDPDEYEAHHQSYADRYPSKSPVSRQLVTELADLKWRLERVPIFEAQLLNLEFIRLTTEPEFAPLIKNLKNDVQILALGFTRLVASKVLPNLVHQEARLARRVDKIERQLDTVRILPPSIRSAQPAPEPEPEPLNAGESQNRKIEPNRQQPFVKSAPKVGRNELCPCKSGRKYKRCCLTNANLDGRNDSVSVALHTS